MTGGASEGARVASSRDCRRGVCIPTRGLLSLLARRLPNGVSLTLPAPGSAILWPYAIREVFAASGGRSFYPFKNMNKSFGIAASSVHEAIHGGKVLILVTSQAGARRVCRRFDIPFTANKGYSSSSAMYEAGRRMNKHLFDSKPITVIYLGDHDPSGIDMSRDVEDRLRLFAECAEGDTITIEVHRVALNMSQIRELKPPENPAKITDSRAKSYIRQFGQSSWELDAIEPKRLAKLVSDAITELLDVPAFEASQKIQEEGRTKLVAAAKKFKQ